MAQSRNERMEGVGRNVAGREGADSGLSDAVLESAPANDPAERQPKGDHNRRLALFMEPEAFAAEAGISVEQLRDYERTAPDGKFDLEVAQRIGDALERLEALIPANEKVIS